MLERIEADIEALEGAVSGSCDELGAGNLSKVGELGSRITTAMDTLHALKIRLNAVNLASLRDVIKKKHAAISATVFSERPDNDDCWNLRKELGRAYGALGEFLTKLNAAKPSVQYQTEIVKAHWNAYVYTGSYREFSFYERYITSLAKIPATIQKFSDDAQLNPAIEDAEAHFYHGLKISSGIIKCDASEAIRYILLAANNGNPDALCFISKMYQQGLAGVHEDVKEAHKVMETAAKLGFVFSQTCVGSNYRDGDGIEMNIARSLLWLRRARNSGADTAKNLLARMATTNQALTLDQWKILRDIFDGSYTGSVAHKIRKWKASSQLNAAKNELMAILYGETGQAQLNHLLRAICEATPTGMILALASSPLASKSTIFKTGRLSEIAGMINAMLAEGSSLTISDDVIKGLLRDQLNTPDFTSKLSSDPRYTNLSRALEGLVPTRSMARSTSDKKLGRSSFGMFSEEGRELTEMPKADASPSPAPDHCGSRPANS